MVILITTIVVFSIVAILYFLFNYTKVFWSKCELCEEKKYSFFFVGETNTKYNHELNGYEIGDELFIGGNEICTECCRKHKLFDNYVD